MEERLGRDDGSVEGDGVAVRFFKLPRDQGVSEVEVLEVLQRAEFDLEMTLEKFPYELGAVEAIIGPFHEVVVRFAFELVCGGVQSRNQVCRRIGCKEHRTPNRNGGERRALDPFRERGALHGLERFKYHFFAVAKNDDTDVIVLGVRGDADGDALNTEAFLEDQITRLDGLFDAVGVVIEIKGEGEGEKGERQRENEEEAEEKFGAHE